MDRLWLPGRTLNGLTVLVQSPNGVSCFCLSVCLAACLFDSPAALYLFVSARTCSPTPTPPPPPLPQSFNLLLCSKKKSCTSSHLPHLGLPHLSDKDLAIPRPKQEVLLVLSFWHVLCVTSTRCAVFFFILICACLILLEHS